MCKTVCFGLYVFESCVVNVRLIAFAWMCWPWIVVPCFVALDRSALFVALDLGTQVWLGHGLDVLLCFNAYRPLDTASLEWELIKRIKAHRTAMGPDPDLGIFPAKLAKLGSRF